MPELSGNKQQNEAIVLNKGPALILAGPGSGKTFTTVERVRYLLTEHGVKPEQILVITFTKAAARQMRERFIARMGEGSYPVTFGTFHAIFFSILKNFYAYPANAILTEKDKREYLRTVLSQLEGDFSMDTDWEDGLLGEFGYLKNTGVLKADFQSAYLPIARFKQAFVQFQRLLGKERRLDFDDFASQCLHLLKNQPRVLEGWQSHFAYILVDEFQDINATQYAVMKLLAGKASNLFVVGDDDQSIYGFRGANPGIMQQFLQDFPEAKQILLATNYRSAPGIVTWAGKLIGANKERMPKQIVAGQSAQKPQAASPAGWQQLAADGSVLLQGFSEREIQYRAIAELLKKWFGSKKGQQQNPDAEQLQKSPVSAGQRQENSDSAEQTPKRPFASAAVIFRTNTEIGPFAEALSRAGVSFSFREKVQNPYENQVCKDLTAYLCFAKKERSRRDFLQIMNKPCRYLTRQALTGETVSFQELLYQYRDKPYMQQAIRRLQTDISRIACMDLYAAVNYVRKGMGYEEWLKKKLTGERLEAALHMAEFFQKSLREFDSLDTFLNHLQQYEKELQKAEGAGNARAGGVTCTGRAEAGDAAGTVSMIKAGNAAEADAGVRNIQSKKNQDENIPPVQLMTLHGSKGLEFELVFLPDCNEGIVPHKKSMLGAAIEEERRMFYVGMTRAKKQLMLSWVSGTKDAPGFPSRFLKDMGCKV